MREKIKWARNEMPQTDRSKTLSLMNQADMKAVLDFHRSFPQYAETPLVNLSHLAAHCGIMGIYIKDESFRFDLNAFKVLGGSYAIAKYIAKRLGKDLVDLDYSTLISDETNTTARPSSATLCMVSISSDFAPMSIPAVGSSMSRIFGLVPSHLATTTFC